MQSRWLPRLAAFGALLVGALAWSGCGDSVPGDLAALVDGSGIADRPAAADQRPGGEDQSPAGDGNLDDGGSDAAPDDAAPTEDLPALPDASDDGLGMPCGNTRDSCGPPGACADCTNSTAGRACVNRTCGCVASIDCPLGSACDPKKQLCTDACAGGLDCNGGCCDGKSCAPGTDNAACGSDGKACRPCGDGTPTCGKGACSASCVVGAPGQPGVCGGGFCCNGNACAAIGNASCGAAGGACVDCARSASGPSCLPGGLCGCEAAKDCPLGQACKGGVCGTACDANALCNGGCCAAGKCDTGTTPAACALGGPACGSCVGNPKGAACVSVNGAVACGCKTAVDCPAGNACDSGSRQCTTACTVNSPCNGGCCSAAMNGSCQKGVLDGGCGSNGGLCVSCTADLGGRICKPAPGGGACGCNLLGDCPITATACSGGVCDAKCSAQQPCQFGCCSNGSCANGMASGACGKGGACVDCAKSPLGLACLPGQSCGCATTLDCPPAQACDTMAKQCTSRCGLQQPCNGGCCSAAMGGSCAVGSSGNACGGKDVCVDCSANKLGHACIGGLACGCNVAADCGPLLACDLQKHQCTDACGANQKCSNGCCLAGKCTAGNANSACGASGDACATCKDGKPTCDQGACSARCGGPSDGACGNGTCCSAGSCVTGDKPTSCGFAGACIDCRGQSTGTKCIIPANSKSWFCGCDAKSDCLAANPPASIAGYACDTLARSCTSLCSAAGVTNCNGGCCSGPNGQCRAGNADGACGISGGFCNSCATICNPGPKCNAMTGACGCTAAFGQCSALFSPCNTNNANRYGCNLASAACCIPGIYSLKDNGNPANCCSGQSMNGGCTCALAGSPAGMPANPWLCCSTTVDGNGKCQCLNNGANANLLLGRGAEPRACCSGRASGFGLCVCSTAGQSAQTPAGCCLGLTLSNGVCG